LKISLTRVAESIRARVVGDAVGAFSGVAALDVAGGEEITFLSDSRYLARLRASNAGAAIVGAEIAGLRMPQLVVENVDAALSDTLLLFAEKGEICGEGVDPTARLGLDVKLGKGVGIGPHVVIGDGAAVGDGTLIAAGCSVGRRSRIGAGCRLYPGVAVYDNCIIGDRVVIQANSVIGSVGFGYTAVDGRPQLVPHVGNAVIEDDVEIGANTCVDRAKFGSTRIGAGTKIDNLVQIAHNVTIGRCCLIAGMAGIAGSCRLGDGVVLGGQVGIRDHISIGDGAMVGGKSFVVKDIGAGEQVFGFPAIEKGKAMRVMHSTERLPELAGRVRRLEAMAEAPVEPVAVGDKASDSKRLRWVAAAIAAGMMIPLLAMAVRHGLRSWLDPDEVRVEKLVAKYQDGDDWFFVTADPDLENLRTNRRLFLIGKEGWAVERMLAWYGDDGDCYFLVPADTVEELKAGGLREKLYFVKRMAIKDRMYALVTTETGRAFTRL